jgi:hypothetical protein
MEVKINPRPVIIYISREKLSPGSPDIDAYKEKAAREGVVIISPVTDEVDELVEVYQFAANHSKGLNIQTDAITVQSDENSLQLAKQFVSSLDDEGIEIEAPVVFEL